MSETNTAVKNPTIGFADDGSRIDDYHTKTETIEVMCSRFGEAEDLRHRSYSTRIFGSLVWSYKYKLARAIIRLMDQNAGMADAQKKEQEERIKVLEEIIQRTERSISELSDLYLWAAHHVPATLIPDNDKVITDLQTAMPTPQDAFVDYAEMMNVSLEEAKKALAHVPDDSVILAEKYSTEALEELKRQTTGKKALLNEDFEISEWNAVSTMEKIVEKAESIIEECEGQFVRTKIRRRRAHLSATMKFFEKLAEDADALAVKYREDAETAMQLAEQSKQDRDGGTIPGMA